MWLDFVLMSIKLRNLKWPASKFQRGWIRTRCTLKYEMLNTDQSCLPSVKLSWDYLLNWVKISFSDSEHVITSWFTSSCRAKHFFWKNNCFNVDYFDLGNSNESYFDALYLSANGPPPDGLLKTVTIQLQNDVWLLLKSNLFDICVCQILLQPKATTYA